MVGVGGGDGDEKREVQEGNGLGGRWWEESIAWACFIAARCAVGRETFKFRWCRSRFSHGAVLG